MGNKPQELELMVVGEAFKLELQDPTRTDASEAIIHVDIASTEVDDGQEYDNENYIGIEGVGEEDNGGENHLEATSNEEDDGFSDTSRFAHYTRIVVLDDCTVCGNRFHFR